MPAFQPYWGKPAVRNDREDRGNVGIIRSPIRASIPPDLPGIRAPGSLVLVPSKGTARDLSALQKTVGVRGPMSRSDDYRRFAAECMKIACTADDEQRRAIFVQMARAWFALAQRGATNVDRDEGLEEEIN
jgi:hypothetical protein